MAVHDAYAKDLLDRVTHIFINAARLSHEKSNSSNSPYLNIERYLQYLSLLLDTKNCNKLMSETERKVVEGLLDFFEVQVNVRLLKAPIQHIPGPGKSSATLSIHFQIVTMQSSLCRLTNLITRN